MVYLFSQLQNRLYQKTQHLLRGVGSFFTLHLFNFQVGEQSLVALICKNSFPTLAESSGVQQVLLQRQVLRGVFESFSSSHMRSSIISPPLLHVMYALFWTFTLEQVSRGERPHLALRQGFQKESKGSAKQSFWRGKFQKLARKSAGLAFGRDFFAAVMMTEWHSSANFFLYHFMKIVWQELKIVFTILFWCLQNCYNLE